jgi:hypothetical protein
MNRIFSTKSLIASAIALGAVVAGTAAHAGNVTLVVGQNAAHRYVQPNRFDRDSRFHDARATQRHAQWGDFDHDGVPNRFDRAPRNPHRH